MSTPTTAITLDQWQILFHETMAALLRAKEAVKQKLGLWGILSGLWKSSRDLKLFSESLKAISEVPNGVLSEEIIKSLVPQLQKLLRSIEDLIDTAKRLGLMNRSLTSAVLGSIKIRGEYVADCLEALEMSIDPEIIREIDEGRAQIERGDFETMEHLF